MTNRHRIFNTLTFIILALLVTAAISACAYSDRVAPLKLPDALDNMVVAGDGLKIGAIAFTDQKQGEETFGFDVRAAGLMPVQVTFQNDGTQTAKVLPEQTFLVDIENNAWPVISLEKVYKRTKGHVEIGDTLAGTAKPALLLGIAGAVAGLAVGIVTGDNIGEAMGAGAAIGGAAGAIAGGAERYATARERIRDDLAEKRLKNSAILPGQIAYGTLFFPGLPEEAKAPVELRMTVRIGNVPQVVVLSLR